MHCPKNMRKQSKYNPNFMQNTIDNNPNFMYNKNSHVIGGLSYAKTQNI